MHSLGKTVLEVTDPKVNNIRHCPFPHRKYSLITDISLTQRMTQIMYVTMIITAPKELLKVIESFINIQKTKIIASGPITLWQTDGGGNGNSNRLFSWAPKPLRTVSTAMKLKDTCSLEEKLNYVQHFVTS